MDFFFFSIAAECLGNGMLFFFADAGFFKVLHSTDKHRLQLEPFEWQILEKLVIKTSDYTQKLDCATLFTGIVAVDEKFNWTGSRACINWKFSREIDRSAPGDKANRPASTLFTRDVENHRSGVSQPISLINWNFDIKLLLLADSPLNQGTTFAGMAIWKKERPSSTCSQTANGRFLFPDRRP